MPNKETQHQFRSPTSTDKCRNYN